MRLHRVLVVGVGSIGERHTRCFLATGRAEVAVCESHPALRQAVAERYGCREHFKDIDQALAGGRFDLALIATPAHLHIPMAAAAAGAGINILVEKPLSTSEDGVAELIRLVAGRGVRAAVAFTYRAHPLVQSMREAIQSGRFGRPVQVVSVWGQHFPKYRPAYRSTYYASRATGGGAIQDLLPHAVNTAEFLVGPIERIMADAAHLVLEGVEVEDTVHMLARHRDGVMACYSLNQHQAPNENSITVVCDRGTARFELNASRWLSMTEPGGEWKIEQTFSMERDDLFIAQANHYLDMIEGKAAPLCTIEEALQTLRVSLAVLDWAHQSGWNEVSQPGGRRHEEAPC